MNKKINICSWQGCLAFAASILMLGSCADGYDSPNGFDVGVNNQTLVTPDSLTFKVSTDGTQATISWPLVLGAKGYQVTMKNIDDPDNPVVVDDYDGKVIDGCSLTASVAEDSRYSFDFQVIGDPDRDNKDGEKIDTIFSTLVESVMTIPRDSDIYTYYQSHALDSATYTGREVAIDLEGGGHYTMSGPIDFRGVNVTVRGNKVKPAFITMTGNAGFYQYAGIKMKFLRLDMTDCTANGLVGMSDGGGYLPDTIKSQNLGYTRSGSLIKDINIVTEPVFFSDVWVKNMPHALVHDNSVDCAWWNVTINNCIIQSNNSSSCGFFYFDKKGRLIKNISIKNSTIYNIVDNASAYFLRYANQSNSNPQKVFGNANTELGSWTFTMSHVTLSRMFSNAANSGQKWANNVNGTGFTCTFDHCIFYSLYQCFRRIAEKGGTFSMKFNFFYNANNPYIDSANPGDTDYTRKDTSGAPFASVYPMTFNDEYTPINLEAENGGVNFKPSESEIVNNSGGDSRWLE